jgi:4'-phosphopantetheinyl transferase
VIAIAPEPVGVDCERLPPGCVCELMTEMGRDDADAIGALPEPERHAAIIRWWVSAEAVLKCTGQGIAHGMSAIPAASAGPQQPGLVAGCRLTPIGAPDGYAAAAAVVVAARGTAGARLSA